ncbi:RTA1-domain-containing protein [Apiospora aurea]|uniref:RTA1-domain-containing protein n=1 Tax=Apiospora aurea TaxID=335848 RepID=A0ABR1QDS8_9PEZI
MPSQTMNQAVSVLFIVVFVSSLLGCVIFTLLLRRWVNFSIPLALACVFEIFGYGIRCSSVTGNLSAHMFVVVTILLTLAPSFVSLAMYMTIERTLQIIGKEHSLIDPGWYVYLIWSDLAGLAVQIVGLGLALSGTSSTTRLGPDADSGAVVVAVGIGLHAATLAVFMALFAVVLCQALTTYRQYGSRTTEVELGVAGSGRALTHRFKGYLVIVILVVVCLLIRDLYRAIGLTQGFATTGAGQAMFALLDGFLVAEAVLGLAVFHPAWVLVDGYKPESERQGKGGIGLGFHPSASSNFI